MRGASSLRWVVRISHPKGDFTSGVDRRWIESFVVTASAPPSGASIVFTDGTPTDVVDTVAAQARAGGSGDVVVAQEQWPPESGAPGLTIEGVDERDSGWEHYAPVFRVYVFEEEGHLVAEDGTYEQGYSTATWDLRGGDVLDAVRWAQDNAGERGLWSVALVADGFQDRDGRGLVWLVGQDYQDRPTPESSGTLDRMLRRRGRRVVGPE